MRAVLDITLLGIDTPHDNQFVIDHSGFDSYILLCFSTPFFTRTNHGIEFGRPGDCILHDPFFPEHHGTPEGQQEGFRNDWVHFKGAAVPYMLELYQVPVNEIIHTGELHLFGPMIRSIQLELSLRKPFWEQKVSLLLEEILLILGRQKQIQDEFDKFTPTEQDFKDKFVNARKLIHQHFDQNWTVREMSELVNLSPERFWVLYQKYFHNSPKDDLISKRLEEAKIQLIKSNQSIEQIALQCGLNSLYYFSRLFKKRIGCTPSDYRRTMGR